jgi:hypothetical protein
VHGGKGVVILSMPDCKLFRNNNRFSNCSNRSFRKNNFNIYRIRELHRTYMASFAKIGLNNKVIEVLSVIMKY